ncbi:MAG: tRNA preQ1(34) S-adenosylmethionine ribosyltransferase-isomerase QueA [Patescibacteria group bacterium]
MHDYLYNYDLPKELIALEPANPRGSSKLMVYDTSKDKVYIDKFFNIAKFLPSESLLVLNSTKVIPSRITMQKQSSGGKAVLMVLINEKIYENKIKIMTDRNLKTGEMLTFHHREVFEVISHLQESIFLAKLLIPTSDLLAMLEEFGNMPIPLYLRKTSLTNEDLKDKYQTIFAQNDRNDSVIKNEPVGSVAAPTASLHFTTEVFDSLKSKHINKVNISLEVGLGTFAPLNQENIESGKLHIEWYKIDSDAKKILLENKKAKNSVVACGTTTVRSLESWGIDLENSTSEYGSTDIFIRPGFRFQIVDSMITNFHLPESSLMMLVQAFLNHKKSTRTLKSLYEIAIQNKFRFFSFGDAMLIL